MPYFFKQIFFERAAVDADADRDLLRFGRTDDLANAVDRTDVAGIDAEFVDSRVERLQRELVVKMNVGDDRHFGPFADLVHRGRRIVIGHGDADDLTPRLDHLLDLSDRAVDIGRVGLCHRLHDDRRTAADLDVANFNWTRNSFHIDFYFNAETAEVAELRSLCVLRGLCVRRPISNMLEKLRNIQKRHEDDQ